MHIHRYIFVLSSDTLGNRCMDLFHEIEKVVDGCFVIAVVDVFHSASSPLSSVLYPPAGDLEISRGPSA